MVMIGRYHGREGAFSKRVGGGIFAYKDLVINFINQ